MPRRTRWDCRRTPRTFVLSEKTDRIQGHIPRIIARHILKGASGVRGCAGYPSHRSTRSQVSLGEICSLVLCEIFRCISQRNPLSQAISDVNIYGAMKNSNIALSVFIDTVLKPQNGSVVTAAFPLSRTRLALMILVSHQSRPSLH